MNWSSQYGVHSTTLGKWLHVSVAWTERGYTLQIGEKRIRAKAIDVEAAKAEALAIAKRLLQSALVDTECA